MDDARKVLRRHRMTPPRIICDTREQRPLEIDGMITRGLATGDYAIEGHEDNGIVIERKSLSDLYGVTGTGRARFERELARLAKFERAAIVIEASMSDVLAGDRYSKVAPAAVMGSLLTWWIRYGVPPIFADTRLNAAATVRKILMKFADEKLSEGK